MTAHLAKTTRAEAVRRRRQARRRFDATTRTTSTVRPLISHPHSGTGRNQPATDLSFGALRRRRSGGLPFSLPRLPRYQVGWRLLSLSIVLVLGAALVRLVFDPNLYVNGVNLGGSALVPGEEIYARSGIAGQHIFWVDPKAVKENVEAVPGIAGATVTVEWPSTVTILVTERIPVVTWVENERTWWVDADGYKFKARQELPGLLPIVVDEVAGKASEPDNERVPAEAIHGALQLRELRPNIEKLHYDPLHGLSYQDGRGWRGYFGVGTDMPQKLAVYERLTEDLTARGIYPRRISVANLDAPYYER